MHDDSRFAAAYQNAVDRAYPAGAPDVVGEAEDERFLAEAEAELRAEEG